MPSADTRRYQTLPSDQRSISLQISWGLLQRIDAQARAEHLSRSAIIHRVLREAYPDPAEAADDP